MQSEIAQLGGAAQQARRKGTQAWVQGDVQRAIQEFSSAVDLEPAGSRARIEALQLRCAGLLRAGRHEEARRCPARQHTSLHPLSALHLLRRHGHRRRPRRHVRRRRCGHRKARASRAP